MPYAILCNATQNSVHGCARARAHAHRQAHPAARALHAPLACPHPPVCAPPSLGPAAAFAPVLRRLPAELAFERRLVTPTPRPLTPPHLPYSGPDEYPRSPACASARAAAGQQVRLLMTNACRQGSGSKPADSGATGKGLTETSMCNGEDADRDFQQKRAKGSWAPPQTMSPLAHTCLLVPACPLSPQRISMFQHFFCLPALACLLVMARLPALAHAEAAADMSALCLMSADVREGKAAGRWIRPRLRYVQMQVLLSPPLFACKHQASQPGGASRAVQQPICLPWRGAHRYP